MSLTPGVLLYSLILAYVAIVVVLIPKVIGRVAVLIVLLFLVLGVYVSGLLFVVKVGLVFGIYRLAIDLVRISTNKLLFWGGLLFLGITLAHIFADPSTVLFLASVLLYLLFLIFIKQVFIGVVDEK